MALVKTMKKLLIVVIALLSSPSMAGNLSLHPTNPHYFLFDNKATVLITSAEHYGAVLNLDFDYLKYLDALAADGLNLTRTFSGSYVEPQGAFGIAENTLAPKPGRMICPWARSSQAGSLVGGNRFDLTKWDEAYFARLKDFVAQASKRGIVVEFTLFCPMYEDMQWRLSPMNAANNVNDLGAIDRNDVHTLDKNGGLLAVQEALVRKVVTELKDAGNVCYEICNEPYFGGVTMDWQYHIADVIAEAESSWATKHLISQNIANGSSKIEKPHPAVSVLNFHYANPPDAVALNFNLNKVIGDNETGFKGTGNSYYRMEAWEFILAGGGLFNHLDYSFSTGHEGGTFQYPATQPGGGNASFRKEIKVLKNFIHTFDFVRMKPARELLRGTIPTSARFQMLAEKGNQYAAYFKDAAKFSFSLELSPGVYDVQWIDVVSGGTEKQEMRSHPGGEFLLQTPEAIDECALKLKVVR